jgi:hypothetical protein
MDTLCYGREPQSHEQIVDCYSLDQNGEEIPRRALAELGKLCMLYRGFRKQITPQTHTLSFSAVY